MKHGRVLLVKQPSVPSRPRLGGRLVVKPRFVSRARGQGRLSICAAVANAGLALVAMRLWARFRLLLLVLSRLLNKRCYRFHEEILSIMVKI